MEHTVKREWLGVVKFAINANVNRTMGLNRFYIMFRRESMIPLHTIIRLPQPEAFEPQDFAHQIVK